MGEPVVVTETTLRGVKKAIQDFVAPEIRDLKGDIAKLSTLIDALEKMMDTHYRAIRDQQEAQYKGILASLGEIKALIGESRAQSELEMVRKVSALSERVAMLEASRQ